MSATGLAVGLSMTVGGSGDTVGSYCRCGSDALGHVFRRVREVLALFRVTISLILLCSSHIDAIAQCG